MHDAGLAGDAHPSWTFPTVVARPNRKMRGGAPLWQHPGVEWGAPPSALALNKCAPARPQNSSEVTLATWRCSSRLDPLACPHTAHCHSLVTPDLAHAYWCASRSAARPVALAHVPVDVNSLP